MKELLLSLSALPLLAALVFTGIYFTRFQSMATLQKITDYSDGYNLYRMDIRYRYSLNDLLARGITDDQSMVDASLGQGKVVKIPFNDYGGTGLSDGPQGQVDTK